MSEEMMGEKGVEATIIEIIARYSHIPEEDITLEDSLDYLDVEGYPLSDIALDLEDEYGFDETEITDETIDSWKTVKDIVDYITQQNIEL